MDNKTSAQFCWPFGVDNKGECAFLTPRPFALRAAEYYRRVDVKNVPEGGAAPEHVLADAPAIHCTFPHRL
ncbi:hypothetical protein SZ66_19435 [Pantoea ananatis]|nr:hypothetical protein [Pantoea ananatis]